MNTIDGCQFVRLWIQALSMCAAALVLTACGAPANSGADAPAGTPAGGFAIRSEPANTAPEPLAESKGTSSNRPAKEHLC